MEFAQPASSAKPTTTPAPEPQKPATRKRKAPAAGDAVRTTDRAETPAGAVPEFAPLEAADEATVEYRKVRIPAHRYTPLRKAWPHVVSPLVEQLKLQVRFNPRARCVELKSGEATRDAGACQKGADFVSAFAMGFEVADALALLRLEDLFVDSFEVKDVKILRGDHLSRAVGRIAGADGKTRFAIENATRTRVVVANTHIHILGSAANIKVARDAICDLIIGQHAHSHPR
eukprot:CAMPEP_0119271616 /NCGR_PEP_ID=MMETSP1329-20130426/8138_1 /TAXON_ID=114041 /ORGANISM="Genus nov. species nov., Strain RCC1024" /LENGTH=230 /DNA_ID=CAMNT_0007271665 /DNA_START=115 /DNA_END=803 /DNA_ORIENTATION=-